MLVVTREWVKRSVIKPLFCRVNHYHTDQAKHNAAVPPAATPCHKPSIRIVARRETRWTAAKSMNHFSESCCSLPLFALILGKVNLGVSANRAEHTSYIFRLINREKLSEVLYGCKNTAFLQILEEGHTHHLKRCVLSARTALLFLSDKMLEVSIKTVSWFGKHSKHTGGQAQEDVKGWHSWGQIIMHWYWNTEVEWVKIGIQEIDIWQVYLLTSWHV